MKEINRIFSAQNSRRPTLRKSNNRFRFADAVFKSLGKVLLQLRTVPGQPTIDVELDVVSADIPALLGMDLLDRESLTPCTVMNILVNRVQDPENNTEYIYLWHVPLMRSNSGHLYAAMECSTPIYISKLQLIRLHRQFSHPSSEKLFNLLSRARPSDATPETRRVLEEISKSCDTCQKLQSAPRRFRVATGTEHIQFNEKV